MFYDICAKACNTKKRGNADSEELKREKHISVDILL